VFDCSKVFTKRNEGGRGEAKKRGEEGGKGGKEEGNEEGRKERGKTNPH